MAPAPSRPDADALAAIQMEEHRKKFDSHIAAAEQAQAQSRNGGLMSQARYEGIVSHLRVFDSLPRKERNYSIHQRYRIQLVGATAWLVPRAEANSLEGLKRYVHTGELFEVLLSEHQAIGHAKHETLHKAICKKYVNITRKVEWVGGAGQFKQEGAAAVGVGTLTFLLFNALTSFHLVSWSS
jgi:hypothetical protein